ncbi:MAG: hypothetical protein AAB531_00310 [Patescibacteria group bacterium]
MINKLKNYWEIFIIFLLSLTPLTWFKDGQIILGHDSGFRLNYLDHLHNLFYSWSSANNFGADWTILKGFLITQAPETFFSWLFNSLAIGEKISFVLWFFIIGVSMYIFVKNFFPQKKFWIFRLFSSTFYMYNFFLLQGWFIAERAKFSLFAVIPLGTLLIYKTLTKEYPILKGAILFSLISFLLNAGGNPTFYGALILVYGITFIYLTIINTLRNGYWEIVYSLKLGIAFTAAFLAVNAYWILPQIYLLLNSYGSNLVTVGGIGGVIGWESVVTKNASFINLLRLQGMPDWYNNNLHPYSFIFIKNPFLIISSFIFPLILLFGLFYHQHLSIEKKTIKLIILLIFLLLFGFIFTAGSHPPLGFLYILFIKYIPGFAVFRSAFYKFGEVLWFSYIILLGFYLNLLLLKFVKSKRLYIFLGAFSIFFLLIYHSPFFNGKFFVWNAPFTTKVTVPYYVNDMANYINKLPTDTRILLLPEIDSQFHADSYNWGFMSLDLLPRLFTNRSIISNTSKDRDIISAIYRAINQDSERDFLQLVNLAGINKILWRGDILYSDKKTNEKSFSQGKNNLENFKEVLVEKKSGAWKLYSIASAGHIPSFYAPENFAYSYSQTLSSWEIFNNKSIGVKPAIVFADPATDKLQGLSSFYYINIVEADCVLCKPNELRDLKDKVKIPYVSLLPDSPFYFLISSKENNVRNLYKNLPSQRVDFDISTASKRIAEIIQIAGRDFNKDTSEELIIKTIGNYKLLINDAVQQSNLLQKDIKNSTLVKILSYLDAHQTFLASIDNKHGLAEKELEELSIFMQEYISGLLDGKIWMTTSYRDKIVYTVNLKSAGSYDLTIKDSDVTPTKIQIDGKYVSDLSNIYLTARSHKLALIYPVSDSLLTTSGKLNGVIDLNFNENAEFGIKNFQENNEYLISFDYKVNDGRLKLAIAENGRIGKDRLIKMDNSNPWNKFSYVYKPTKGTTSVLLKFFPASYGISGTSFELRNITVIKSFTPLVVLSRTVSVTNRNTPDIHFQKINPTKYVVRIAHASYPYILSFQEAYNRGWKAYIADSNSFPEEDHFEINGYANAWLIKQKGDYNIIVEYYPQRSFYIGIAISTATLFSYMVFYLFKKYEKNRK